MRPAVLACLVLLAACNSKPPSPQQQPKPGVDAAADATGATRSSRGSAGDPAWVDDPPEVLRAKINGVNAHVIVLKGEAAFAEYRDVLRVVEKVPGVVAAEPFYFVELEIEKAGRPPQRLSLKAVDPAHAARILTVGRTMRSGSFASLATRDPPPIILGDALARMIDASVGDDVTVRPRKDADPALRSARPTVFRVAGTFHVDFIYDEELGITSLPAVQAMLGRGDRALGVEMIVEDLARSEEIAKVVERALGGPPYQAMDWYELNHRLFEALGHRRP